MIEREQGKYPMSFEMLAQFTAVVGEFQKAEVDKGFPMLRRTPSSVLAQFLDYWDEIASAERAALLDACATIAALNFMAPQFVRERYEGVIAGHPAYQRYREAARSTRFGMGLRYSGVRDMKYAATDAEAIAIRSQTLSRLPFIPRDDPPPSLVADPDLTRLKPAKAPQLRKLVSARFREWLGAKRETKFGKDIYAGVVDDTPMSVSITYSNRGPQLIYGLSIPDDAKKVFVSRATFGLLFAGDPGWNYLTEENAEASIALLGDCAREIVGLRNALMAIV